MMAPLVVDVTELALNPVRTGVQRVVRELLRHWPRSVERVLASFDRERGLVGLPPEVERLLTDADERAREAAPARLKELVGDAMRRPGRPIPADARILVPELFYDHDRCAHYRQRLARDPEAAAFIVYDLIPWLWPERIGVGTTAPLMRYLQLIRDARQLAFISAQTRAHLTDRIRRQQLPAGPVLPLGADGLGLERQRFDARRRTWVVLGSIDGRKNQDLVFAAFEQLWADGFDGDLVMVGRVFESAGTGWLERATGWPRFRHMAEVSDETIRTILRTARATIYVSTVEGFGLPPVESLHAGIPVVVTNAVPSVAELPPAGQVRIEVADVGAITAAIRATADDDNAARLWSETENLVLGTWRDFGIRTAHWASRSLQSSRPAAV